MLGKQSVGVQRERSVRNVDLGNVRVQVVTEAKVVAETVQRACSEFRGGPSGRPEARGRRDPLARLGRAVSKRGEKPEQRGSREAKWRRCFKEGVDDRQCPKLPRGQVR